MSYHNVGSLFDVNYTKVGAIIQVARRAIVDRMYVKFAGFGPDHDVSVDDFVEKYGSHVSKRAGDEYYGGKIVLGALDGYHRTESMGGITGQRMLFNAMRNKRCPMVKVGPLKLLLQEYIALNTQCVMFGVEHEADITVW